MRWLGCACVLIAVVLAAACSRTEVPAVGQAVSGPRQAALSPARSSSPTDLYVSGDGVVRVFTNPEFGHNPRLVATITAGISQPRQLAFDSSGTLYVVNSQYQRGAYHGSITEYRPGKRLPLARLDVAFPTPVGVAIDTNDNVYVSSGSQQPPFGIAIFPRGALTGTKPRYWTQPFSWKLIPCALTFDSRGRLWFTGFGTYAGIYVVDRGSREPKAFPARRLAWPGAITFTSQGDMMVTSHQGSTGGGAGWVNVYHPGETRRYTSWGAPTAVGQLAYDPRGWSWIPSLYYSERYGTWSATLIQSRFPGSTKYGGSYSRLRQPLFTAIGPAF
jgi:sugar lactone lactonase YvrE